MSVYENLVVQFGSDYPYLPDTPANSIKEIPDDTVVCYTCDGQPVYYKADFWSFKAYCPRSVTTFNFKKFPNFKAELKQLVYARLYFSPNSRSVTSVPMTPLNTLTRWAKNNNISITAALNDSRYYPFIASSYSKLSERSASVFLAMIRELRMIRVIHSDMNIAPPDDDLGDLLESTPLIRNDEEDDKSGQTPIIPSRLYSAHICNFQASLEDYMIHSDAIYRLYEWFHEGFASDPNFITRLKKSGRWETSLQSHGLLEFCQRHELNNKKTFSAYLTDIQNIARIWVHIFTGMRKNEVDTTPYNCMEEISTHGVKAHIIRGATSKLSSQNATPTFWVTTDIAELGVKAAQHIGRILSVDRGYEVDDNEYPLFPQFQRKKSSHNGIFKNAPPSVLYTSEELNTRILNKYPDLFVRDEDIRELELFDGFRDWSAFCRVGEPWPLATHQLRRSLAVYMARSGYVSIGSQQVQFKHLCSAMASYYRKGSAFAVNFVDTGDNSDEGRSQSRFIESMEQEKKIAEYLNYEKRVIENQGNLWGGEGKRINRAYEKGEPLVIVSDREETQKRFERGEMAYKDSPIGGCTKLGKCNRLSITVITACVGCEHSILDETTHEKINQELDNLYKERDQYPKESLLYQHTQDQIDELKRKIQKGGKSL